MIYTAAYFNWQNNRIIQPNIVKINAKNHRRNDGMLILLFHSAQRGGLILSLLTADCLNLFLFILGNGKVHQVEVDVFVVYFEECGEGTEFLEA